VSDPKVQQVGRRVLGHRVGARSSTIDADQFFDGDVAVLFGRPCRRLAVGFGRLAAGDAIGANHMQLFL